MDTQDKTIKKTSYRAKDISLCPICSTKHYREELFSGGGRLIAADLTKELRRHYTPSKKYGVIIPLIYSIMVCPDCLYASYPKDFLNVDRDAKTHLKQHTEKRKQILQVLFGHINFTKDRDLISGLASYILAIDCYHFRHKPVAPTFKKGLSSLRAAWLLDDLFHKVDYRPYDVVRDFYYMEALHLYKKSLLLMQTGKEPAEAMNYLIGPDTDHNWGYDGILYLNAYLTYKLKEKLSDDLAQTFSLLQDAQQYLSKIYGLGKASLAKPVVLVNMSKDLFDEINTYLKEANPS